MKMQAKKACRNKRIIGMYLEGYSLSKIANELNIKRSVVTGVIKYHVEDKTARQPVKYKMSYKMSYKKNKSAEQESRIQTAKEMRAQGYGYEAIGKALGVSRQRAHQLVNDYN